MPADIPGQFAILTCRFEDLHAVVVEGQRADLSPDMAQALAGHVREGLLSALAVVAKIDAALP